MTNTAIHVIYQGHPTVGFGEYLFGRPKIACDIRIQLQRKLEISLAKHYHGLSCQEDLLVPIVFIKTNMLFRAQTKVS